MAFFGKDKEPEPKPSSEPSGKRKSEPLEGELLLRDDYEGTDDRSLGGRPRLYDNPKQFNDRVADYYEHVKNTPGEPLTLTGMCLFMGFSGRDALFRYATYPEFQDVVTRARTLIEYGYERCVLIDKNNAAGRLLASIGGDNFWNPTQRIEPTDPLGTHEDRLAHLK